MTGPPRHYLFSWRQILVALGYPTSSAEARRRLRRLNDLYAGPILFPGGRGGQPRVDQAKLLAWWEGLEATWANCQARRQNAQATVAETYPHGRVGAVAPGVAGRIKPRRRRPEAS